MVAHLQTMMVLIDFLQRDDTDYTEGLEPCGYAYIENAQIHLDCLYNDTLRPMSL